MTTTQAIETLAKGEFVKVIRAGKAGNKVYQVEGYCRFNKAYMVTDCDDVSSEKALKKGTQVAVGFDY